MKIARVYLDTHLGQGFEGLTKIIRKDGQEPNLLGAGNFILFLNRKGTAFKMLAGKDYLTYYKNGNRRIPLEAIQHLPTYFSEGALDLAFSKAVEKAVRDKLKIG